MTGGIHSADEAAAECSVRYLRVSSKRQMDTDADIDPDGNSIDTQRKVTAAKERALGTVNVGEYVEPGNSAQTIDRRPVFRKMLKRIIEQRDVKYIIIDQRSRAFRNYGDAVIVKRQFDQLGVKLISAREDFGDGIWADAMGAIKDVFNDVQVRLNGQDIALKMGNKAKNGGTISHAKLGYLNESKIVDGHKINTISLDPERSRFITLAFDLFATGQYTIDTLQRELADAGLTMPPRGQWGNRPPSRHAVGAMLRDRYYTGEVCYQGIWYPGRHQPLVLPDLFDRVQPVLDAHSGSGTRDRTHKHYLKGLLWCARCKHRLIITRGKGNGGEYFYFLCRGRQERLCDLPYIPVEILEEAVADHYAGNGWLPAPIRAQLRTRISAALDSALGLSEETREECTRQLAKLDRKEHYYLDLAAEEEWPKDKLREKIKAIRAERGQITRSLEQAEHHLDTGRQVFYLALDMLDSPGPLYRRSGETIRAILNKTFFTRLYVDARKITDAELKEPFNALLTGYRTYRSGTRTNTKQKSALLTKDAPLDRTTVVDALTSVFEANGSSTATLVVINPR